VDESDLALLDGTFWKDDELIQAKRSRKTARDMGHTPLWGERGMLKWPFRLGKTKRVIIHINNTNPVLNEEVPSIALCVKLAGKSPMMGWSSACDFIRPNFARKSPALGSGVHRWL